MKKEIWKFIPGYEYLYEVSNLGRVKSLNYRHTGKISILKLHKDKCGYRHVRLTKEEKGKMYLVHRLVAMAFIPNPYMLPEINHKDEIPGNDFVFVNPDGSVNLEKSNLEWCDRKYNNNYGAHCLKISDKLKGRKNSWLTKTVLQYTLDGQLVREWSSTRECGRNGFDQSAVSACCRGIYRQSYNYIWKFKNV